MAPAYSIQIFAGALAVGTAGPVLTVPAGSVWVLRDIESGQTFATGAYVGVRTSPGGVFIVAVESVSGEATSQWQGRVVFPAGSQFYFQCFVNAASVYASGYQLSTT